MGNTQESLEKERLQMSEQDMTFPKISRQFLIIFLSY